MASQGVLKFARHYLYWEHVFMFFGRFSPRPRQAARGSAVLAVPECPVSGVSGSVSAALLSMSVVRIAGQLQIRLGIESVGLSACGCCGAREPVRVAAPLARE